MTTRRPQPTEVLATFADERSARDAATALEQAGLGGGAIRVGERGDEITSLQAEQREEMEHTFMGPGNVGPFTKEMMSWMLPAIAVGALIGAALCAPLAWLRLGPGADIDFGVKLLVVLAVGAVTGSTIGFVAAGGRGARGPAEPLAGEAGVTMSVPAPSREAARDVAELLRERNPIRIDLTTPGGQPFETTASDGELAEH